MHSSEGTWGSDSQSCSCQHAEGSVPFLKVRRLRELQPPAHAPDGLSLGMCPSCANTAGTQKLTLQPFLKLHTYPTEKAE